MLQTVLDWDKWAFLKINHDWVSPVLDSFIPWLRYGVIWYPFYLFLIVFVILNYRRQAVFFLAAAAVNITASDMISSRVVKAAFERLRPCNDPALIGEMILRVPYCSGGYSFTSSHACNHFALATFLYLLLAPQLGRHVAWIFLWAGLVSYAQVYVGVHYPLDILGGAVLGSFIGWASHKLYYWLSGNHPLELKIA